MKTIKIISLVLTVFALISLYLLIQISFSAEAYWKEEIGRFSDWDYDGPDDPWEMKRNRVIPDEWRPRVNALWCGFASAPVAWAIWFTLWIVQRDRIRKCKNK